MIVTVDICILNMVPDLKPNVWTCNSTRPMIVVTSTLELELLIPDPLLKTKTVSTDGGNDTSGTNRVQYVDAETQRRFVFENNNSYSMDGLSVHTISSPRDYIITSGSDGRDLFTTG